MKLTFMCSMISGSWGNKLGFSGGYSYSVRAGDDVLVSRAGYRGVCVCRWFLWSSV